jgi:oligopeptide/dipeptide ABC transporter ATP-binding protein
VFAEPGHPYTHSLLDAFPSLRGPRVPLTGIPGSPPSLLDPPTGCRFAVLRDPKHPYTRLLLDAVPDPRAALSLDESAGHGEPPRVVDPAPGCRFRWRCPLAVEVCSQVTPELVQLAPEHGAACHVAAAREGRGDVAVAGAPH